jgi:hypothetical protein
MQAQPPVGELGAEAECTDSIPGAGSNYLLAYAVGAMVAAVEGGVLENEHDVGDCVGRDSGDRELESPPAGAQPGPLEVAIAVVATEDR